MKLIAAFGILGAFIIIGLITAPSTIIGILIAAAIVWALAVVFDWAMSR